MRYCVICGDVFDEYDLYRDNMVCEICGDTLKEDDMTALKYAELSEAEKDTYDEQLLKKIQNHPCFTKRLYDAYNSTETGEFWSGFRPEKYAKFQDLSHEYMHNRKSNKPFKPFAPIDKELANKLGEERLKKYDVIGAGRYAGRNNNFSLHYNELTEMRYYAEKENPPEQPRILTWYNILVFVMSCFYILLALNDKSMMTNIYVFFAVFLLFVLCFGNYTKFSNYKQYKENREKYYKKRTSQILESKQLQQQKENKTIIVHCPYCHSTNTSKISNISKGIALGLFGKYALHKVHKQWHCNSCGSDF